MPLERILFTMTPRPYRPMVDYAHPFDLFGGRLNAFQGPFTLHSINRPVALHMLAQNVPFPSKVLEFPTLEELREEVLLGYDYFAMQVHSNMEFRDAMRVCEMVRELSPHTQIILGGHGVTCYTEEFITREEIESLADHVCWGDGVAFIRELFGVEQEVDPVLPPMEFFIEMLPDKKSQAGVLVPGVGCKNRCAFCATGHFFDGTFVKLHEPDGMYRIMCKTQEKYPRVNRFALFDELFLSRQDDVRKLGDQIYRGDKTNLSSASYFTFSDFRSIAQYDPDDLVRWGVSRVFLGVESTTQPLPKTRGLDLRAIVESLHSRGIETILSLIFGMKHHTPETLENEMTYFLDLGGIYNQVTIESPIPGTPNWEIFKRQGRIDEGFPVEHIHGYSAHYKHPHFKDGEVLEKAKAFQRRIFEETGPAILKGFDVALRGYEYCLSHGDSILQTLKSEYHRRNLRNEAAFLWVAKERAENSVIWKRASETIERYLNLFGSEDSLFEKKGIRLLRHYDSQKEDRSREEPQPVFFDLRTLVTEYLGVDAPVLTWTEPVGV